MKPGPAELLQSEELREVFFEDKVAIYELLALTLLTRGKAPRRSMSASGLGAAFLDLLGNRVTLSRGRSSNPSSPRRQALRNGSTR